MCVGLAQPGLLRSRLPRVSGGSAAALEQDLAKYDPGDIQGAQVVENLNSCSAMQVYDTQRREETMPWEAYDTTSFTSRRGCQSCQIVSWGSRYGVCLSAAGKKVFMQ